MTSVMAQYDNGYSRAVAGFKVTLPLVAIAILSGLVLLPGERDMPVPHAADEVAREQRISAPDYAGTTRDGAAIRLRAETARPDRGGSRAMSAEALEAEIDLPDGSRVDVMAAAGGVDEGGRALTLTGDVRLTSSTGYVVETDRLTAALDLTRLATDGPVAAEGPAGRIDAGRLVLAPDPDDASRYAMSFRDGVSVVLNAGDQP